MTFVPYDRPVRAAFIGLGRIYDLNVRAYRDNPDVEVVALVDPSFVVGVGFGLLVDELHATTSPKTAAVADAVRTMRAIFIGPPVATRSSPPDRAEARVRVE